MMRTKILYIHHGLGQGGAPKSLSMLIAGLDKKKFEAIVALPDSKGNEPVKEMLSSAGALKIIQDARIKPFHGSILAPCNSLKEKASAVLSSRKLALLTRQLVGTYRPDIIHLNSTSLVAAAKGGRSVNPNIPVIAHVREPLLQNWWGRWLASMNLNHTDHFISIDRAGAESISRKPIPNCNVIYNFVDRSVYQCEPARAAEKRKSLGLRKDQTVFLYLCRVSPANGALEMVRQIKRLKEKLPDSAVFLIAGFHEQRSRYSQDVSDAMNSCARCIELGYDPDPVALLDAADVVIAPFTQPHSARSVFEGAAMGKPAIVTNLPHLNELVVDGGTGFLYDLKSDDSFLNTITRLCDVDLRDKLGLGAFEYASQNFDMKSNIAKTVSVYDQLLQHVR